MIYVRLTLNWNNIGESLEAFSAFCGGLSQNESLEFLDLRNNQISSAGANELSTALKQNHSLKVLGTVFLYCLNSSINVFLI